MYSAILVTTCKLLKTINTSVGEYIVSSNGYANTNSPIVYREEPSTAH